MTAVHKGFVDVPHGQVHFRFGGRGPVVVMLHDSPRSSVLHVPSIEWLGEHFTVLALDTPGYGNSTPLPQADPEIPDFAAALATALDALGIERCALYGCHTGARIALRFAVDHPGRAALTILDGLALPGGRATPEFLERGFPDLEPVADGSHLVRLWARTLDFHRYYPWFERRATTRLALEMPDDLELHEHAVDLLMAGRHWSSAHRAALRHPAAEDLPRLRSRAVLMAREDDVLYGSLDELPQPLPASCSVERIAPQLSAWRTRVLDLLRTADLPRAGWTARPPAPWPGAGRQRQCYVDLVPGQLRVRLRGPRADGVPVLLLHDVPGGSCSVEPLAVALAADRPTLAPDLPGLGESHPLPYPSLGSYVTALLEMLEALDCGPVDLVAEGLGASFAIALAAHHPAAVRRLALDGLAMVKTRDRRAVTRQYCPPLAPDRYGTQLLLAWQQARDTDASWPWFDRTAAAARRHDPEVEPGQRHAALVEIVKQLPSYGDAARGALEASVRDILKGVHQPVLLLDVAHDVRYAGTRRAARHLAHATVLPRPAALPDRARMLREFLA